MQAAIGLTSFMLTVVSDSGDPLYYSNILSEHFYVTFSSDGCYNFIYVHYENSNGPGTDPWGTTKVTEGM